MNVLKYYFAEKYDNKLVLPKMEGFALSPGQNLSVAVYIAAHGVSSSVDN